MKKFTDREAVRLAFPSATPNPAYTMSITTEELAHPILGTEKLASGEDVVVLLGCYVYESSNVSRHTSFCYFHRKGGDINHLAYCAVGQYAD